MASNGGRNVFLPVPAITAIKNDDATHTGLLRGIMERTTSADIRQEGKELQEAAEQTLNVILDLTLDGNVRWASPTWEEVVGTPVQSIQGRPIANVLIGNNDIFAHAIESMQKDDSGSKFIKFSVNIGPDSAFSRHSRAIIIPDVAEESEPNEDILNLEAQGIMVYDRSTGEASHTMWMVRPSVLREVTIDLPEVLVESLGDGAELLAQHLTQLADSGMSNPQNNPPPLPVLCRICERQITPWWFPKHTELCLQEHRAEAELQLAQENLSEHRNALVKVLDSLEAQSRYIPLALGENTTPPPPAVEYKGLPIGSHLSPSSPRASQASPPSSSSSRERPSSGLSHSRARSFAVRRPLSRIIELVLDLCDTALEISQPALRDTREQEEGEYRTLSPQSEGRISQVLQWQSPSAGAPEQETGLSALCDDTATLSKAKVEAVLFFRRIMDYSERIRSEFTTLVQDCIDAALQKAAQIAAGEDSSDSADDSLGRGVQSGDEPETEVQAQSLSLPSPEIEIRPSRPDDLRQAARLYGSSYDGSNSAMSLALRASSTRSPSPTSSPPKMSSAVSNGSSSPRGSSTPKFVASGLSVAFAQHAIPPPEYDPGADSDNSVLSLVRSRARLSKSPAPELNLPRITTSRERKRTSLVLARAPSVDRQQGFSSASTAAVSPLRIPKPRLSSAVYDHGRSPIISPTMAGSEFCSPTLPASQLSYHRRQSSAASSDMARVGYSPRLSLNNNPQPRAFPPSIKDFEIIKPISKGAFGSVYLAKKKSTGDYYAIKALKKADMVAKNQVANVKAERAILMWQGESDFVAKLYWTFPSKDYIFLVMEYLNGGDCASLIHALGTLPENWAKRYMAEVILGVEHLHNREIVHRDLKPDNLLIDQKGHLKLTDFGLSRMGLIGRQARALSNKNQATAPDPLKQGHFQRSVSMASSRSASASFDIGGVSPGQTPNLTPVNQHEGQPSYFSLTREASGSRDASGKTLGQSSEAGEAEQLQAAFRRFSLSDDPWGTSRSSPREDAAREDEYLESFVLSQTTSNISVARAATPPQASTMLPPPMALFDPENHNRKFVGTPDYLAPETINGVGQDEMSDWWSLGCILFEFLFGYPPFHADTPEQVFEKILARNIDWPEDDEGVSDEARDFLNRLMCVDANTRLGANPDNKYKCGGEEVRNHPWFSDIDWETLNETEASFIPAPENPEDTEYFDARGATTQDFSTEFQDQDTSPALTPSADLERPHDALSKVRTQVNSLKRGLMPLHIPPHVRDGRTRRLSEPIVADDFGQFSFKNLPVLEKANKDVIQKLRAEAQAQSRGQLPSLAISGHSPPSLEGSPIIGAPLQRAISINKGSTRSASPSTLSQTNSSSPSRISQPSSPLVQFSAGSVHERRKTSSGSTLMAQSASSLQSGSFFEVPRLTSSFRSSSTASSPVRSAKPFASSSVDKMATIPSGSSPRARSHTVGSNDSDNAPQKPPHHYKRRSQVIDVSPSSSDTDEARQKALLRVQKRRQRSRRLSQISIMDGPIFRPLDVLVCEDHPVSRLVISKLLEKLRCRTIVVQDGAEAMRLAMSSVKFDLIMMEFRLPQINGADVARMIRETKNTNCHTPVVAVTGYLKDLQAPHHFDALVEKPPTMSKLTEVMSRLCSWKPQSIGSPPTMPSFPLSNLRKASLPNDDSPASASSSYAPGPGHSLRGSSREDSMSSTSVFTDADARNEDATMIMKKNATYEWRSGIEGGLGISEESMSQAGMGGATRIIPTLVPYESAPASLESDSHRRTPSTEAIEAKRKAFAQQRGGGDSGDDEDEELGRSRPRSRSPKAQLMPNPGPFQFSTEMLRTGSHNTVVPHGGTSSVGISPCASPPLLGDDIVLDGTHATITPPEIFPLAPGDKVKEIEMDPEFTPRRTAKDESDPEQTPRASSSPRR